MAKPPSTGAGTALHAIDWRFLLPQPPEGGYRCLVLLGGPPGLAERIREVGLAEHVTDTIPPGKSADAVVSLHGTRVAMGDLARCLVPGGVLYYEIDRRSRGLLATSPRRIRRSLRDAGLFQTAIHAVVPDFRDPRRMYLPLDAPGPLRWYVTTRYDAFTPWRRFLEAGLRAVTGLDGRRFAPLAGRLAITAVAGRPQVGVPSVLGHPALPSELQESQLRVLLLTSGGDRAVLLPFAVDSSRPSAVLKIPRLPAFSGRTENEQTMLGTLWSRLDSTMRRSVPRPLGTLRSGGVTVGIESNASGQLLSCSSARWGASRGERLNDLRLAAAWLGEFHAQTELRRPGWGASEISQWVEGPFEAYRHVFGMTDLEDRLFSLTRAYVDSIAGSPLPIVLQHRDFTVWNIARNGRELAVLDWEGTCPGPALCDLLHFVAHWYDTVHHAYDEAARQRCFRRLLFERAHSDPFRQPVHDMIAGYLDRLEMDRRFLPLLLVYTWVELALRRADQQRLQEKPHSDSRVSNRYRAFVAILAEHAEQLFSDLPGGAAQERR